jgi:hypothetical protein
MLQQYLRTEVELDCSSANQLASAVLLDEWGASAKTPLGLMNKPNVPENATNESTS